jgi:arylsulfatase
VAARFMECFAAFLSHADAQIGRLVAFLEELGELDDTLIVLVSDNGASAEGGERGSINDARLWNGMAAGRRELRARIDEIGTATAHNNYPWGWTMAGNTPFRRWKREVHEGGIADPCIVHWPRGIAARGEIRHQFAHAIDVAPTILDLVGITPSDELNGVAQSAIHGTSLAPVLATRESPEVHTTQYFEMLGSRGIYHDGWKAVTFKPLGPMYNDGIDPDAPFEDDVWELFHVAEDLTECVDLAAEHPEKLAELIDLWWEEARKYDVLPLDNRPIAALLAPRREWGDRARYVFLPSGASIPENVTVNVRNRDHTITAVVDVPDGESASGTLLAMANRLGGWSLHLLDGRLRYVHSFLGREQHSVVSDAVVPPGAHELGFAFASRGDFSGTGQLLVDGTVVAEGEIARTTPVRYSITGAGLTCGWEQGPPVGEGYDAPFRFSGTIHRVVVEVAGAGHRDPAAEFEAIMAEQ